jgi:hypothetical protein
MQSSVSSKSEKSWPTRKQHLADIFLPHSGGGDALLRSRVSVLRKVGEPVTRLLMERAMETLRSSRGSRCRSRVINGASQICKTLGPLLIALAPAGSEPSGRCRRGHDLGGDWRGVKGGEGGRIVGGGVRGVKRRLRSRQGRVSPRFLRRRR